MRFELHEITRNVTDNKRPLAVRFTTDQKTENIYYVDVAGRHLKTFAAFREIVCDELAVWLDDPSGGHNASARREDWEDLVSRAFDMGRRLQASPQNLANEGGL